MGRGLTALALEELVGLRVAEREAWDVGVHGEREPVRPVLRRVGQDCGGDDLVLLGGAGLGLQQVRREATDAVHWRSALNDLNVWAPCSRRRSSVCGAGESPNDPSRVERGC